MGQRIMLHKDELKIRRFARMLDCVNGIKARLEVTPENTEKLKALQLTASWLSKRSKIQDIKGARPWDNRQ